MTKQVFHYHHIIPKHMGGSNEPENLIKLTIEEHALAHKKLFELHGKIQDKYAWLMLSGKTSEAESIRIQLSKIGFQDFLKDEEKKSNWIQKISDGVKATYQSFSEEKRKEMYKNHSSNMKEQFASGKRDCIFHSFTYEDRIEHYNNVKEKMETARLNSEIWRSFLKSGRFTSAEKVRGSVWINNNIKNKRVNVEDLNEYLSKGWQHGMLIFKKEPTFLINNDETTIEVNQTKFEEMDHTIWKRGNLKSKL